MKNIFISSTFRDMQAERDLVQERVLPELREEARKYGENVGVIDLRWGVDTSELETDEGSRKVLSVCLDEIERSHPYMLIFMGERYGWIPDSKMIQSAVAGKADNLILDDYEKSITALEIEYGALSEKYGELDKCVVCFRSPLAHLIKDENEQRIYLEKNSKVIEKLHKLQERMRKKLGDRIIEYTAEWNESVKRFENFKTIEDGQALEEKISRAYLIMFEKDWEAFANLTWQQREQLEVQAVMESKLKCFRGREKLLAQYREQLEENHVLVLQGKVGSGKTSIMCKLMQMLEEEGKKVFRFISGNTVNSSRSLDLLKQMVWFMEDVLGVQDRFEDIEDDKSQEEWDVKMESKQQSKYDEWKEYFDSLCLGLPKEYNVYFCLDALDHMQQDEHIEKLDFLPKDGANIHLVASCTTEFELPLTFARDGRRVETVPLLALEDAAVVIQGLGIANSRNVYESIRTAMLEKKDSGNPLYLSFLMQRLNMMDQEELHDSVDEKEIVATGIRAVYEVPENLEAAAVYVLDKSMERLSEEGETLREILNLMAASRNGLRKEDLDNILRKQGKVYPVLDMARLLKYLEGFFVVYNDGRIDFGHKVIRKGLREQLVDMRSWQTKILEHLKELPEEDELRNREGMHFARVQEDMEFAQKLIYDACRNEWLETKKIIAEEAVADLGEFYGKLLGKLAHEKNNIYKNYIMKYFMSDFEKELDLSNIEIMTKQNCFKSLCEWCDVIYQRRKDNYNLRNLAISYEKMGNLCEMLGCYAEAEKYYDKILEYSEQLHKEVRSISSLRDLAISHLKKGDIYEAQGCYVEAEQHYIKGLEYCKQIYEKVESISGLRDLAISYSKMGDVCKVQGRYTEAGQYYVKGLEYSRCHSAN